MHFLQVKSGPDIRRHSGGNSLKSGKSRTRRPEDAWRKVSKTVRSYIWGRLSLYNIVSRCFKVWIDTFLFKNTKNHLKSVAQRNIILIMTDRTHKNKISDLESDLDQKKAENAKNSAKSRKLKNELKRQTDSIASAKSQVFITNCYLLLQFINESTQIDDSFL